MTALTHPAERLWDFVEESNRIEGIMRTATDAELSAHAAFLALDQPRIDDVQAFVSVVQPGAILRDRENLNVSVGNHIAPRGGPAIRERLAGMLARMSRCDPWEMHVAYETLHPFTDGNGRSGRTLWAWRMIRLSPDGLALGFLHRFYYQTLERSPGRPT